MLPIGRTTHILTVVSNMTKSIFIFLICFSILLSCKEGDNKIYSSDTICECYSESEFDQFDSAFNNCLTVFNEAMNKRMKSLKKEDLEDFGENQLFLLTKELVQTCPKYQKDFNTVLLARYSNRNKDNLDIRIESLLKEIDSVNNKAGRYIQLAELEILNEDYKNALNTVNISIKMDPEIESSYFVRGFLYHRNGQYKKAISDYTILRDITKQKQLRQIAELNILNLEQELK